MPLLTRQFIELLSNFPHKPDLMAALAVIVVLVLGLSIDSNLHSVLASAGLSYLEILAMVWSLALIYGIILSFRGDLYVFLDDETTPGVTDIFATMALVFVVPFSVAFLTAFATRVSVEVLEALGLDSVASGIIGLQPDLIGAMALLSFCCSMMVMLARSVAYNDCGSLAVLAVVVKATLALIAMLLTIVLLQVATDRTRPFRQRAMDTLTIGLQLVLLAQLLTALVRTPARTIPALLEKQEP